MQYAAYRTGQSDVAAAKQERVKEGKYSAAAAAVNIHFIPFAMETYGKLGTKALRTLARRVSPLLGPFRAQSGLLSKPLKPCVVEFTNRPKGLETGGLGVWRLGGRWPHFRRKVSGRLSSQRLISTGFMPTGTMGEVLAQTMCKNWARFCVLHSKNVKKLSFLVEHTAVREPVLQLLPLRSVPY